MGKFWERLKMTMFVFKKRPKWKISLFPNETQKASRMIIFLCFQLLFCLLIMFIGFYRFPFFVPQDFPSQWYHIAD
jgi:hypothetical protein